MLAICLLATFLAALLTAGGHAGAPPDGKGGSWGRWDQRDVNAGLGESREEIVRNITASGSRTLEKAAEAAGSSERAQRLIREHPQSGKIQIADHVTRSARKAQEVAHRVAAMIKAVQKTMSLDQLRDIERQILRLETLADVAARAAAFYADEISMPRRDVSVPAQGPTNNQIAE
ncbi:hypothetical protein [Streptomyces sp. NPDC087297]|uniref:hypothetical protein n=1 Tax=Streptomyces sp. NPDC087297 TaxID=3365778 RepID=UPI003810CACA